MTRTGLAFGRILLILLFSVCLLLPGKDGTARAERVYIDITQPNFQKLPIAVPELKRQSTEEKELANEMSKTLSNDLLISGLFDLINPALFKKDPQTIGVTKGEIQFDQWQKIGAEFLVRGFYEVHDSSLKMEMRLFDTVNGDMLLGKVFGGRVKDWRAMIHRFADEILLVLTGERGVFETKIAFVQSNKEVKEIYVVDFDGENLIQVTKDRSINLSPAWSPDGTRLAYVSFREGATKIYVLNLMDGSSKLLSGFPGLNIAPSWKPGTRDMAVTLSKDGNPNIYSLSSSGKVRRKLVDSWGIDVSPTWSPDGRYLAYVSGESGNPQIYVLEIRSGEKRRITFTGNYNTSPSWSPKGNWIAYSGLTEGHHDIYVIRVDGNEVRRLTQGEGNNESPTWSPDGRMLAYNSTKGKGKSAIWVMLINGTGKRRLTNLPGAQLLPDWSPHFVRR